MKVNKPSIIFNYFGGRKHPYPLIPATPVTKMTWLTTQTRPAQIVIDQLCLLSCLWGGGRGGGRRGDDGGLSGQFRLSDHEDAG